MAVPHDVFNTTGNSSDMFPNDETSTNEVERKAQMLLKAAADKKKAEELAEEARKRAEQDALDVKMLREQVRSLESQRAATESAKASLELQKKSLESEKTALEEKRFSLESEKVTLQTQKVALQDHISTLESEKRDLTAALENAKKQAATLDSRNDLPPTLHDRVVQFCLAASPYTGISFGNPGCPHGWSFSQGDTWMWLRLKKTDPSNPQSSWLITKDSLYMEVDSSCEPKRVVSCGYRRTGDDARKQEWYIGRCGNNGWMIESVPHGWVHMEDPERSMNGKSINNKAKAPHDPAQNFLILLR